MSEFLAFCPYCFRNDCLGQCMANALPRTLGALSEGIGAGMPQWSPKAEEVDTRSAWEKRTSGIQGHWAELDEENTIPNAANALGSKRTDFVMPIAKDRHLVSTFGYK